MVGDDRRPWPPVLFAFHEARLPATAYVDKNTLHKAAVNEGTKVKRFALDVRPENRVTIEALDLTDDGGSNFGAWAFRRPARATPPPEEMPSAPFAASVLSSS